VTQRFEWSTPATFEVVNVLTSTEERDANARWLVRTFLYAEDYLRELIAKVPLAEPIDLDTVDWNQVYDAFLEGVDMDKAQWLDDRPGVPA
jgi:hypothetical protein